MTTKADKRCLRAWVTYSVLNLHDDDDDDDNDNDNNNNEEHGHQQRITVHSRPVSQPINSQRGTSR